MPGSLCSGCDDCGQDVHTQVPSSVIWYRPLGDECGQVDSNDSLPLCAFMTKSPMD